MSPWTWEMSEAEPVHLVHAIKRCLEDVYDKAQKRIRAKVRNGNKSRRPSEMSTGSADSYDEEDTDEALDGFQCTQHCSYRIAERIAQRFSAAKVEIDRS